MARVTVEDCVRKVPNRFDLVVLSSERVREIMGGAPLLVHHDNDKNPVIALREIAGDVISPDQLRERLISGYQANAPIDDDEDILESLAAEQEWISDPESQEMSEEIAEEGLTVTDEAHIENADEAGE